MSVAIVYIIKIGGNSAPLVDSLFKGEHMSKEKTKKQQYDIFLGQISKIHIGVALSCFRSMIDNLYKDTMKPETKDYLCNYHRILYFQNLQAELTKKWILKGENNDKPKKLPN